MVFTDSVGKFLFAVETFPIASRPRKHAEFGLNLYALIRTALLTFRSLLRQNHRKGEKYENQ